MKRMTDEVKGRLVAELSELTDRHAKLAAFLAKHADSDDLDIRLLRKQAAVMADYAEVLEVRLRLNEAKPIENKSGLG